MDATRQWAAAMRAGDYAAAWSLERAAVTARDPATRDDPALPYHLRWVWDGSRLDGRDVVVRCYHGLGDTIQFARYLPLLEGRARRVTVEVQPRLIPLLQPLVAAPLHPFDPTRPLPPGEVDVELSELPCALEVAPEAVSIPYLNVAPTPLPSEAIGLCYRAGEWDQARSLSPALLTPLAAVHPCVTLVSEPSALPVLNPAGCPLDMMATAALVAGCDLVVTVDTMIAHLAGALGQPTWLLLKAEPDWRWSPAARTSAWYPSVRQYVQPRPGAWEDVVGDVMADLAARRAERIAA